MLLNERLIKMGKFMQDKNEIARIEKRNRIVAVAYSLFIKRGLEKVSVRDIAGLTEMNINSIYYYFRTKAEIVICCVEYGLDRVSKQIFDLAKSGDLKEDRFLSKILDCSLETKEEMCWCYQVITSPNYNWLMKDIVISVRKRYSKYIDDLARKNNCQSKYFKLLINMSVLVVKDYIITEDKNCKEQFKAISNQIKCLLGNK